MRVRSSPCSRLHLPAVQRCKEQLRGCRPRFSDTCILSADSWVAEVTERTQRPFLLRLDFLSPDGGGNRFQDKPLKESWRIGPTLLEQAARCWVTSLQMAAGGLLKLASLLCMLYVVGILIQLNPSQVFIALRNHGDFTTGLPTPCASSTETLSKLCKGPHTRSRIHPHSALLRWSSTTTAPASGSPCAWV